MTVRKIGIMCHNKDGDSVNSKENLVSMDRDGHNKQGAGQGDNNNNFFNGYNNSRPYCACMGGERRVRKRHPATVQTPGRQMTDQAVIEPLVINHDNRLDSFNTQGDHGFRDFNDNIRVGGGENQDKFYEIQFVMDFRDMWSSGPQRHGGYEESSSSSNENLRKTRILSSKLK